MMWWFLLTLNTEDSAFPSPGKAPFLPAGLQSSGLANTAPSTARGNGSSLCQSSYCLTCISCCLLMVSAAGGCCQSCHLG